MDLYQVVRTVAGIVVGLRLKSYQGKDKGAANNANFVLCKFSLRTHAKRCLVNDVATIVAL